MYFLAHLFVGALNPIVHIQKHLKTLNSKGKYELENTISKP
jgi:hypothetical protein